MFRYSMLRVLLALQVMCFGLFVIGDVPAPRLLGLDIQTKHKDEVILIQAAAGLVIGKPLTESDLKTALAAVELTDRFRKVDLSLVPKADGVIAQIKVDSWPVIKRVVWQGDVHKSLINRNIRGLRVGMRPGNLKLSTWGRELEMKLVEIGYPYAKVFWAREQDDKQLTMIVRAGVGTLLRKIDVIGDPAPYTEDEIRSFSKLSPGRTLWTASSKQEVFRNIYMVMRSHRRYEAKIYCQWDENGTLSINVKPGPSISIDVQGGGTDWFNQIRHLIPLDTADCYNPELLYEGDRRIVRYLQNKGYLDATVWHRREETSVKNAPYKVTITYTICRGKRYYPGSIRFIGNMVFKEKELKHVTKIPVGIHFLQKQVVSPDFLDELEIKIKSLYLSRGYSDISLRRQLEFKNGKSNLLFKVKEGSQQLIKYLKLELPSGWFSDPSVLGQYLALIISDKPKYKSGLGAVRRYRSDRPQLKHIHGSISFDDVANKDIIVTLTLSKPIPLVRGDLARVVNAIRQQCLPSVGVVQPLMHLGLESVDDVICASIKISSQPIESMHRLVVSGADKTKAKTIFREIKLQPNLSLDINLLNQIQSRLNDYKSFQKIDVRPLLWQEGAIIANKVESSTASWGNGDLHLVIEEGPPYIIRSSLNYEKNQGYCIGLGLTQLNVGGMGRTIDYGMRVGNGSIKSKALKSIFPVGKYSNTTDSITASYTDPYFSPGALKRLPVEKTQYHIEVTHLREYRLEGLLFRQRVLNDLQWSVGPNLIFQLGHRWEHVTNKLRQSAYDGSQPSISAPFIQLARDTRDSPVDPLHGMYSMVRVECANQPIFFSGNDGFIKLDLRNQWFWPLGRSVGKNGILALKVHLGIAKPTNKSDKDIPRFERFFAGSSSGFRGAKPDALGLKVKDELWDCAVTASSINVIPSCDTPIGGQGLILINMDYSFPCFSQMVWGEVFVDSGQVYSKLSRYSNMHRPGFRTAFGLGLVFKIGIPIKMEYATDMNYIVRRHKNRKATKDNQFLFSAGYQF